MSEQNEDYAPGDPRDRSIKIKPGFLVNLSTRLEGGVTYSREDIDRAQEGATERTEWKTEKVVADKAEHDAAVKVRGRVRSLIRGACTWTPFGLICSTDKLPELDARIAEARDLAAGFNYGPRDEVTGLRDGGSAHTKVHFSTIRGEIAENAAEAVHAVRSEVRGLVVELEQMLRAGNVRGIRDVAANATQMSRLLEEGSSARTALDRAVAEARRVAREVVRKVEEGAEAAAVAIETANMSLVATARHAFDESELGDIDAGGSPQMPTAALGQFAGISDGEEDAAPSPAARAAHDALLAELASVLRQVGEQEVIDKPAECFSARHLRTIMADLNPVEAAWVIERVAEHSVHGEVLAVIVAGDMDGAEDPRLPAMRQGNATFRALIDDLRGDGQQAGKPIPLVPLATVLVQSSGEEEEI